MFSRRRGIEVLGALLLIAGLAICLASPSNSQAATEKTHKQKSELKLAVERSTKPTIFYRAQSKAKFRYRIRGNSARNLKIKVTRRKGAKTVKSFTRKRVEPGGVHQVSWSGTKRGGSFAGKGPYFFQVQTLGGKRADRNKAKGDRNFRLYSHKFPLRTRHSYGDGFGAGRGHDGQDLFANCGSKIVAAHAGRVTYVDFQAGAAGHYVVISGDHTKLDYTYVHMRGRGIKVHEGEYVSTGETIGKVGESGDAVGCHLHFELWQGPWYRGGHPRSDVDAAVRRWDRWS